MARAVWNGSIAFGLVNIPIKLYPATQPSELGFHLLCDKCHSRLRYKRWCPKCRKEVKWEDVVKGVEIKKGNYFVMTKENIAKLKPEGSDFVEITEFTDLKEVDPIYFNKFYYAVPSQKREKAYYLFRDVLASTAKVAVGKFVMRDREHLCMIEAYKNGLLMTTLLYAEEIRPAAKIFPKEKVKVGKEEISLAKEIIDRRYNEDFDLSKYENTFMKKLKARIMKAIKGEKIEAPKRKRAKKKTLMQALKASVK